MRESATISPNKGEQVVDCVYLGEDILTHILKRYSSPKRIKVFRGRYSKKMPSPTFSKIWLVFLQMFLQINSILTHIKQDKEN